METTNIKYLLILFAGLISVALANNETTHFFYRDNETSIPGEYDNYKGTIDLNSLGVTSIKTLYIDASAWGGAQSESERISTSASVSFMHWYIDGDALDRGSGHCDVSITLSGIKKINGVWIADSIVFAANLNGYPFTNTGLDKQGNTVRLMNINLGSGVVNAECAARGDYYGGHNCAIFAVLSAEEWKPFDEASGDWYVYQDWYPVDDGHMRRVERQDWRKGERCVLGASPGAERNVTSYYKEKDELRPIEKWEYFDRMIRDWYDVGEWTPAASTIPYGQVFTQTKSQAQDWRKGKRWVDGPQKGVEFDFEDYNKNIVRTQEDTGTAEQWEAFDTLVRDWYDAGGWMPDAGTVLAGEAFTQTKQQAQDWRKGERCVLGPVPGAERNVTPHAKSRSLTQSATGTMEVWNPVYWWTEWYPISEWTPDAGLFLTTQTFEQTIRLKRDQYMREVSNTGNIRKDNTYIQSEYKSDSRIVQGARQPEANVTIDTKAPEIEIQSNSNKSSGQYYIIPD